LFKKSSLASNNRVFIIVRWKSHSGNENSSIKTGNVDTNLKLTNLAGANIFGDFDFERHWSSFKN
jgi:hypothetical protein